MKKYERVKLNAIKLLESNILDIRGEAWRAPALTADAYFSHIESFIENAQEHRDAFLSVVLIPENVKTLKELEARMGVSERKMDFTSSVQKLEEIRRALTDMGYDKLNDKIEQICGLIKTEDYDAAKKQSEAILGEFEYLLECLNRSYIPPRNKDKEDDRVNPPSPMMLKEALEYFDYVEQNRKPRVLAVDDVAVVLNSIISILSPQYEVFAIKESSKVEAFLEHNTPELFLLDIEMDGMTGFELIPVIRKIEKHKDTPIVILTGNASLDNLKDAVALGACDFITKPVNKDILLEKIAKNIVRIKAY